MTRLTALRIGSLYLPIVVAFAAAMLGRRHPRRFAACLLAILWTLPSLLILERLNQRAGWWSFPGQIASLRQMPIELYLGWAILWGLIPQLLFPRLNLAAAALMMAAFDLAAMPLMQPLLILHPQWLIGEMVAVALVLVPALCLARWTRDQTHLPLRAGLQLIIATLLFLYLIPEIAFAIHPGRGWSPLLQLASWQLQAVGLALLLPALPGIGAVMEFAIRGSGTPIPYDPPQRLVASGIYRYCANPMQLSCALVMVGWALLLRNPWLLIPASISIVYSAGLANWDEAEDLNRRFGATWRRYRANVKPWQLRWLPYHAGLPATLYIASTCGPCSELRAWLELRQPIGLEILPAESLPAGSIRRMRYDPCDGSPTVEGVRAMGRALEHLHIGWAFCGTLIRIPLLTQFIQLAADAAGLGPRTIPSTACESNLPSRSLRSQSSHPSAAPPPAR